MLAVQHHPLEVDRRDDRHPSLASSYFAPPSESEVAHHIDASHFAAASKSHTTRRLAFGVQDSEQRGLRQEPGFGSEHNIRHSDVSYRMLPSGNQANVQFREPVIVPPSCPSAVFWDGGATGSSVLLRHGSGCSFTVPPSLMDSLVCVSSDNSSPFVWGNVALESSQANLKLSSTHSDSKFIVNELCSTAQNPFPSHCRIVFVQSSSNVHSDASRFIPQEVFASAIMDLASRMCSASAPLGSLSAFIVIANTPCPSMPMELSLCSISSSFQVSLSPIKAMAVLDSGVLQQQVTSSQASTPTLGWLTIDRRRRLIPVLAGDPMLDQFAVVGVFVSGVQSLQSPIVSAACTWFNSCCNVNRSLIPSDGSFLLLLCASASNSSPIVQSLYEAHPNFSKQPFSMRCSEFISCHGSAVTFRPQLVVPDCLHPFALAMDQFSQDPSAVSSEFFSGFHEISSFHAASVSDENKHLDRNLVTPCPEPALSPQPSVCPQHQAVSSVLDNPSLVFQKRPVPFTSSNVDVTTCAASNSLVLVQTIIQQQNTISKLQCEKDQLLIRIIELESLVSEKLTSQIRSGVTSESKNDMMNGSVTVSPNPLTRNSHNEVTHVSDAVSTAAPSAVISVMSNVNCNLPASSTFSDSCSPLFKASLTKRPIASSSSASCDSSLDTRQTFDSGMHSATNLHVIPCASECDLASLPLSDVFSHCLLSSKTDVSNLHSSVVTDSAAQFRNDLPHQKSPRLHQMSHVENDSISFTIPKISYTPLSDDDDSEVVTSFSAHHAVNCSDDSSGSSLS
jgi:hypothetical protein